LSVLAAGNSAAVLSSTRVRELRASQVGVSADSIVASALTILAARIAIGLARAERTNIAAEVSRVSASDVDLLAIDIHVSADIVGIQVVAHINALVNSINGGADSTSTAQGTSGQASTSVRISILLNVQSIRSVANHAGIRTNLLLSIGLSVGSAEGRGASRG